MLRGGAKDFAETKNLRIDSSVAGRVSFSRRRKTYHGKTAQTPSGPLSEAGPLGHRRLAVGVCRRSAVRDFFLSGCAPFFCFLTGRFTGGQSGGAEGWFDIMGRV